MSSWRVKHSMMASLATGFVLLLGGCASNAEKDKMGDEAAAPKIRCPAGYMMICEAKKTGRIRFGRIGKDNLDSCACQPEYGSGRPEPRVIPQ